MKQKEQERFLSQSLEFFDLAPAVAFRSKVNDLLDGPDRKLPILPFRQQKPGYIGKPYDFYFRPGELTVWSGQNGCGKSMLTSQVALYLIKQNARVCIASMEMAPERSIMRMLRQSMCDENNRNIDRSEIENWYADVKNNLLLFSREGRVSTNLIIDMIDKAVRRYKTNIFFIDSLTMCLDSEDDYDQVKNFVDILATTAKVESIHINLICHMRKRQNNYSQKFNLYDEVDKSNIRGTSLIADLACNVFTMARNIEKLKAKSQGLPFDDNQPDLLLHLCKQRNGESEPYIPLWFDKYSLSFCDNLCRRPMPVWRDQKQDPEPEFEKEVF